MLRFIAIVLFRLRLASPVRAARISAASPANSVAGVAFGAGVTEFDAADATLVPAEFVALTVKVYAVPLVKPVTVSGEEAPVAVRLPGLEVTV
jgi:hypothetical protein